MAPSLFHYCRRPSRANFMAMAIIICSSIHAGAFLLPPWSFARRISSSKGTTNDRSLFYSNDRHEDSDEDSSSSSTSSSSLTTPMASTTPSSQDSSWTLREDWALIDQLPKFTVGQGEQTRTFWTQLVASTAELSSKKSPDELYQRCQQLSLEQKNDTNINIPLPLHFGPPPPLLSRWRMDLTTTTTTSAQYAADNRAVGTLEDGRVIWLHYHVVGRLPGDLFSDASSPSLMALIPGGYLEAIGGRIYELGEPTMEVTTTRGVKGNTFWQDDEDSSVLSSSSSSPSVSRSRPNASRTREGMAWWLPATTGTVSALLASSVLSACIGYGAGLGMIADESSSSNGGPHHTTVQQPLTNAFSSNKDRHGVNNFNDMHYKSSYSTSTPSLEERKARAEYRILREQRVLQKISEQLERDQADLRGLERIQWMENQQEADITDGLMP